MTSEEIEGQIDEYYELVDGAFYAAEQKNWEALYRTLMALSIKVNGLTDIIKQRVY